MITDSQLRPSQAQTLAVGAGTVVSTNSIDLLSANSDIGRGKQRRVYATLVTALAGGTSVQAQYIQSANSDLSSPDVLASGPVVIDAAGTVGAKLLDVVAPDNTKRYVGFQYVLVGIHTAGAVSSYILADTPQQPYLPSNTGF